MTEQRLPLYHRPAGPPRLTDEPEKPRGRFDWSEGRVVPGGPSVVVSPDGERDLVREAQLSAAADDGYQELLARQKADTVAQVMSGDYGPTAGQAVPVNEDLHDWWMTKAAQEIMPLTAKMQEYGGKGRAQDLIDIGRKLVEAGVKPGPLLGSGNTQEGYLAELGIYFYIQGKMGRWAAAVAEGRPVSDDTIHDIGIYVRMVQRIRETGGWPE